MDDTSRGRRAAIFRGNVRAVNPTEVWRDPVTSAASGGAALQMKSPPGGGLSSFNDGTGPAGRVNSSLLAYFTGRTSICMKLFSALMLVMRMVSGRTGVWTLPLGLAASQYDLRLSNTGTAGRLGTGQRTPP